jgi:hypothetical protein
MSFEEIEMAQSNNGKNNKNPTLITLAFLGLLAVLFVVVIGVLPYRNQPSPAPLDPKRQFQFGVTDYLTGNYKAAIDDFAGR